MRTNFLKSTISKFVLCNFCSEDRENANPGEKPVNDGGGGTAGDLEGDETTEDYLTPCNPPVNQGGGAG